MKENKLLNEIRDAIDIAIAITVTVVGTFLLIGCSCNAQTRPTKDSVYKAQSTNVKVQPRLTPYKWEDSKGQQYPIYIGQSGACFVYRTSAKGNVYKQYLGEEISRDICLKMEVEYAPKNKKGGTK